MTTLENLVRTPLAKALGRTLFHSLWEGAIVAIVLVAALFVIRSSRVRYISACLAMLSVLTGFGFTFFRLMPDRIGTAATTTHMISRASLDEHAFLPGMPVPFRAADLLPWLVPFWIAGVILFHLRSLASWLAARRLRRRGVCRASDSWQQRLFQLRARLQVSKPVTLLETCLVDVPVVIGYLCPVILVPVGLLAGMPTCQMEAILLHELAHIRRRDYLANLLQTMVEGFLFYHPAIWWISSVIRAERENCCDDLVVAADGNAHEYAAALVALEQTRWDANQAVMAATGGSLMKRIRRLLDEPGDSRTVLAPFLSAGILMIVAAGGMAAWQAQTPAPATPAPAPQAQLVAQAQQPLAPPPEVSPYTKWLSEDVVYIIEDQERAAFQRLQTDEERDYFMYQFWLRRDPTPGTPENEYKDEHYRRMAYANSHFASRSGTPGWGTDRGMIYIKYGPADEIEDHSRQEAGGSTGMYPYQQWSYRYIEGIGSNVQIEFADTTLSGEYHMTMDPSAKDLIRRVR